MSHCEVLGIRTLTYKLGGGGRRGAHPGRDYGVAQLLYRRLLRYLFGEAQIPLPRLPHAPLLLAPETQRAVQACSWSCKDFLLQRDDIPGGS